MRRIWVGFGFMLVAAVGVGLSTTSTIGQQPGGGDKDPNHRRVTVTGVGTVTVKPDTARLSFGVKGMGMDFKTAVAECDKKGAAVEKAITDLKLGGLEIKKGPIHLTTMNAQNFFPGGGPLGPPPVPMQPGRLAPFVDAGNGPAAAFVNAQVNPPLLPGNAQPAPVNPQPLVQPAPGAIQPPQPGMGPMPIQPGGLQPFPQPFPGMHGGGVDVVRSYTVVATFGGAGNAGELADIVKVTDRIQTAVVGAGGTESPLFLSTPSPFAGFGPAGPANPGVVKIEFHRANPAAVRQDALKLAVADAVANAQIAAGVAKLTTKDVVALSDQNPQLGNPFGQVGGAAATGRGEVLGETEITVQVSVTFSY